MTDAQVPDRAKTAGTTVLVGRLFRVRRGRGKRFEKELPKEPEKRPARIALQLALAYRIQRSIDSREIKDQAEAARRLGLTSARVSQLLDLTLLAPEIQERLLNVEAEGLSERTLRSVSGIEDWGGQRQALTEEPRLRPPMKGGEWIKTHKRLDLADEWARELAAPAPTREAL